MKNKKGFTLIELLAVIVILAIIALIAVPVIMNIISKARKSAFEDTAYGIISAGEMYYAEMLLEPTGMTDDKKFTFDGAKVPEGLNVKGSMPTGEMTVTKDGKVAIAVDNGAYCITKATTESGITTVEKDGDCVYKKSANPIISSTTTCVTSAIETCTEEAIKTGIAVSVKVNDTEIKDFYVVSDNGEKLILIMDRNVTEETVAWLSDADFAKAGGDDYTDNNTFGPITALNYLEEKTSSWTNVPKNYTTTDDNSTALYSPITRASARARMLTYTEASTFGNESGYVPSWLYGNLAQPPYGYWLSSASADYSNGAWYVDDYGSVGSNGSGVEDNYVFSDHNYGVRPVIEIPKTII